MLKRVLVTGGFGFIGQHTLAPLIERGYDVHVTTLQSHASSQEKITVHSIDLLDCNKHLALMKQIRPTHLLHTAWYTENGKFWDAVENVYWLKTSISLAEAFYTEGGQRILGLGTCAEYDWNEGVCVEGKTAENPSSLYGKVKKSAYECLNALAQSKSRNLAWARIFFPYGPGEAKNRLIPYVIANLLQGNHANCTHGNQIRDFLHVSDMGHALAAVLDSEVTGAINIGSGSPVKIREIVTRIAQKLDGETLVKFGSIPEPPHSPAKILANIDKLKNEVGWTPTLPLDEGLSSTISWWRNLEMMNLIRGE